MIVSFLYTLEKPSFIIKMSSVQKEKKTETKKLKGFVRLSNVNICC